MAAESKELVKKNSNVLPSGFPVALQEILLDYWQPEINELLKSSDNDTNDFIPLHSKKKDIIERLNTPSDADVRGFKKWQKKIKKLAKAIRRAERKDKNFTSAHYDLQLFCYQLVKHRPEIAIQLFAWIIEKPNMFPTIAAIYLVNAGISLEGIFPSLGQININVDLWEAILKRAEVEDDKRMIKGWLLKEGNELSLLHKAIRHQDVEKKYLRLIIKYVPEVIDSLKDSHLNDEKLNNVLTQTCCKIPFEQQGLVTWEPTNQDLQLIYQAMLNGIEAGNFYYVLRLAFTNFKKLSPDKQKIVYKKLEEQNRVLNDLFLTVESYEKSKKIFIKKHIRPFLLFILGAILFGIGTTKVQESSYKGQGIGFTLLFVGIVLMVWQGKAYYAVKRPLAYPTFGSLPERIKVKVNKILNHVNDAEDIWYVLRRLRLPKDTYSNAFSGLNIYLHTPDTLNNDGKRSDKDHHSIIIHSDARTPLLSQIPSASTSALIDRTARFGLASTAVTANSSLNDNSNLGRDSLEIKRDYDDLTLSLDMDSKSDTDDSNSDSYTQVEMRSSSPTSLSHK